MTLDTRIYVVDHVDLRELFTKCQELLGQYDEQGRGPEQQRSKMYPGSMDNEPGQNLPGWLIVYHGGERPYRTAEQSAAHDTDFCNIPEAEDYDDERPLCAGALGYGHRPPCWYEVSLDTAYSYRGPNGMRCSDLHASYIAELGMWLDARNVGWKWKNEYSGEIHEGYEPLAGLAANGRSASSWFDSVAAPAIAAHIASEATR